jgi:NADH-quinone oxidoreductase subunit N
MNAIIISAIWGVLLMFSGVFLKNQSVSKYLALFGSVLALVSTCIEMKTGHSFFNFPMYEMIKTDAFNLLFIIIIHGIMILYFLLNAKEISKVGSHVAEYYALIFFILSGIAIAATFNTLLMLFLGIEIISIPLYILTGSDKRNLKSNEAALKYFLMGAFSTGIMLMGIAFIYGGNPNASFYIEKIDMGHGQMPIFIGMGLVFMLVSMSFKVSAAPFHFWTPDVYDGAPTVFTSFMSTVVKAAGFFAFLRLFEKAFGSMQDQWQNMIAWITFATLLIGNITAVFQQSVKRMLAYSSIAQAGFMMLAVFAVNGKAKEGILLYSAAYSLATIGIFGVLTKMEDYTISGFNGLSKSNPVVALTATVFLLSLTGVPLTAGFQSKFFLLISAVENGNHLWLVIAAVLFAAISAYYYFRVIQAMYFKTAESDNQMVIQPVTTQYTFILVLIAILILIIGVYPELIIGWMYR